jgi:hypothetical protein
MYAFSSLLLLLCTTPKLTPSFTNDLLPRQCTTNSSRPFQLKQSTLRPPDYQLSHLSNHVPRSSRQGHHFHDLDLFFVFVAITVLVVGRYTEFPWRRTADGKAEAEQLEYMATAELERLRKLEQWAYINAIGSM